MADYIQIKNGSNIVYPVSWQEAFNLTIKGTVTPNSNLPSGFSYVSGDISYALNSSRSIGKIYGEPIFQLAVGANPSTVTIPLGFSVKATGSSYSIILPRSITYTWDKATGMVNASVVPNLQIASNGSVSLIMSNVTNNSGVITRLFIYAPACIYFFEDFGDVITPDPE